MKIVKRILIGIVVLLLLIVVVSFFLPSKSHMEKTRALKASPAAAYAQINNLRNWEKWSPWSKMDPKMKIVYSGPESGKDAAYTWESENGQVGKGKMWISDSKENEMVNIGLEFDGMGGTTGTFKIESDNGGSKVTWAMDSDNADCGFFMGIMGKYMSIMMKGMMEGIFDQGLADLDAVALAAPAPALEPAAIPTDSSAVAPASH